MMVLDKQNQIIKNDDVAVGDSAGTLYGEASEDRLIHLY